VNPCGILSHELRNQGTGKTTLSSAADRFEVPGTNSRQSVQELQIGGTGGNVPDLLGYNSPHCGVAA
jgi:hypothetical protein